MNRPAGTWAPALALALTLALGAPAASAQTLWERALDPHAREARAALAAGDLAAYGVDALDEPSPSRQRYERAAQEYERALAFAPDLVAALAGAAEAREHLGDHGPAERHALRALELAPQGPWAAGVLFELALVHTNSARFADARDDYLRALDLPMTAPVRAITLGNLADTYVSLGDLARAVEAYEACVADDPEYDLGWLGLAVTYDRDGRDELVDAGRSAVAAASADQAVRAALRLRRLGRPQAAVQAAGTTFRPRAVLERLGSSDVFFVPPYDRYYYDAIAHEAVAREFEPGGRAPTDAVQASTERAAARTSWETYASLAPPDDPWLPRVRRHMLTGAARPAGAAPDRLPAHGPRR